MGACERACVLFPNPGRVLTVSLLLCLHSTLKQKRVRKVIIHILSFDEAQTCLVKLYSTLQQPPLHPSSTAPSAISTSPDDAIRL